MRVSGVWFDSVRFVAAGPAIILYRKLRRTGANSNTPPSSQRGHRGNDLDLETAEVSLLGDRASNQDRATIVTGDSGWLLTVADGMGGHAGGELAAEEAIAALVKSFRHCPYPVDDPETFIEGALLRAHRTVVGLGADMEIEERPRTTITMTLIQEDVAHLGHVGDSRIYHIHDGKVAFRTRDHSHVETLHREGMISEEEMLTHPLRHYVDSCLGGEDTRPQIDTEVGRKLEEGDILLLCSDGFWTPLDEAVLAEVLTEAEDLDTVLEEIAGSAVEALSPAADNTTAVAVRCVGH